MIEDAVYNEAIRIWLVRNDGELKRLRKNKANKELTEREFAALVTNVDFGVTPLGCPTCGDGGNTCIDFKYRDGFYEHEFYSYGGEIFDLIKSCCEIVEELK